MLRLYRTEVLMTQTSQFSDQPVASADLRNVMRYYLTGVTIVTLTGPDKKPYIASCWPGPAATCAACPGVSGRDAAQLEGLP